MKVPVSVPVSRLGSYRRCKSSARTGFFTTLSPRHATRKNNISPRYCSLRKAYNGQCCKNLQVSENKTTLPSTLPCRTFTLQNLLCTVHNNPLRPDGKIKKWIYQSRKSKSSFGVISRTSHNLNITSKETPTFPSSMALIWLRSTSASSAS